jgi:transcriptional regulator with XRE-family HTH domain
MKMAERIRRARRKAGLTQAAVADRLQVQRSAVSNWESINDIQPSLQHLIALAKICDSSFEWLGTGRGSMTSDIDFLDEIPAARAELVDAPEERELLAMFRNLPTRTQQLVANLVETLHASRGRAKRLGVDIGTTRRPRRSD